MYPSLGSARFWLELLKKKLGSARYVFEKARFLKNAQNEPKIKCLETGILIKLKKKKECMNFENDLNCLTQANVVRFSKFKSL